MDLKVWVNWFTICKSLCVLKLFFNREHMRVLWGPPVYNSFAPFFRILLFCTLGLLSVRLCSFSVPLGDLSPFISKVLSSHIVRGSRPLFRGSLKGLFLHNSLLDPLTVWNSPFSLITIPESLDPPTFFYSFCFTTQSFSLVPTDVPNRGSP